ncbi:hypothetical protein AMS68_006070 [Peltaster fructicola]|uniref:N-acetyltransferase domain-containing protein n=1 Tax=Peltaster fructicola TaxID=286661 RepID=A0A6H0Y0L9_9PEZI|nr:hypothetical protein AMS68_006070 [Peltaster fructicola]
MALPSSPLQLPCSPCSSVLAAETLTPPSSPPRVVSSTKPSITQHQTNAFSVLGKRKAPLSDGDNNARPQKRATALEVTKLRNDSLTQMHLSLGQKIEKRCKECGMVYIACSAEDRSLHDQYHNQLNNGYDAGAQFLAKSISTTILGTAPSGDTMCVVTRNDPPWRRKHARNVLDIITKTLGACEISDEELWRAPKDDHAHFELWMYMRGSRCIAAALVELPQHRARRVIVDKNGIAGKEGMSAMERLRQRRSDAAKQVNAPLMVSEKTCTAAMGICRIWTAPAFQKQGLAMLMLDSLYHAWSTKPTQTIGGKLNDVAFSQPTAAGTRLARKWFGSHSGWLVYS